MKEKLIPVQIFDYDSFGFYHIAEEKEATKEEIIALTEKARESVKVDWTLLPEECRHIVYYAELIDKSGEVVFVGIYMHGEAYTDNDFYRTFWREDIGFVRAIHKHD